MAEPKKETVPLTLPQRLEATLDLPTNGARHDRARILPLNVATSPILHPLPKPAGLSAQPGPTARPATTVVQPAPTIVATANAINAFDSIPRSFCWGLLGISALIFLIQIWNYALS